LDTVVNIPYILVSGGQNVYYTNSIYTSETTALYKVHDLCANVVNLPVHETFGNANNLVANNWGSENPTNFTLLPDGTFTDNIGVGGLLNPPAFPPDASQETGFCNQNFSGHTPDEVLIVPQTFYVGSSSAGSTNGRATPVYGNQENSPGHSLGYYLDHGCPEDIFPTTHSSPFFRAIPSTLTGDSYHLATGSLYWCAQDSINSVQVWVGAAGGSGTLCSATGQCGAGITGHWITNGMQFLLQNVTGGSPGSTLATVTVSVQ
jgi:hypothetical protein